VGASSSGEARRGPSAPAVRVEQLQGEGAVGVECEGVVSQLPWSRRPADLVILDGTSGTPRIPRSARLFAYLFTAASFLRVYHFTADLLLIHPRPSLHYSSAAPISVCRLLGSSSRATLLLPSPHVF